MLTINSRGGKPREMIRSTRRQKEGTKHTAIALCVTATEASGTGTHMEVYTEPTSTIRQMKEMISEQMVHADVPEAQTAVDFIGLCHRGRILNDEFPVGVYHFKDGDTVYLRIAGFGRGGQANCFPFCTEPTPEPQAMTITEIKDSLREAGIFKRALTFEQLVELSEMHNQKETRPARLTDALFAASCSKDFHSRRKVCEVNRKVKEHKAWMRQHGHRSSSGSKSAPELDIASELDTLDMEVSSARVSSA